MRLNLGPEAWTKFGRTTRGLVRLTIRYEPPQVYRSLRQTRCGSDCRSELVITAEGSLDGQSPYGKIPCEVGRRARRIGALSIALAGTIGNGVRETLNHGIDAFASILKRPCSLDEAIAHARKLTRLAAEDAFRMVLVGRRQMTRPDRITDIAALRLF